MTNQRRIRFDGKYKSWRGPVLESCMNKSNDVESNCFQEVSLRNQTCPSESRDIDQHRTRIRNAVKSSCLAFVPPKTPRTRSFPEVTWRTPSPMEDHSQRSSAFDFGRPSRIYQDDSEEVSVLTRRSHLLFDELKREREGNKRLRREVIRLRDKNGRIRYLVEEINDVRMQNDLLASEIQRRRQGNDLSRRREENNDPLPRPKQRPSRS